MVGRRAAGRDGMERCLDGSWRAGALLRGPGRDRRSRGLHGACPLDGRGGGPEGGAGGSPRLRAPATEAALAGRRAGAWRRWAADSGLAGVHGGACSIRPCGFGGAAGGSLDGDAAAHAMGASRGGWLSGRDAPSAGVAGWRSGEDRAADGDDRGEQERRSRRGANLRGVVDLRGPLRKRLHGDGDAAEAVHLHGGRCQRHRIRDLDASEEDHGVGGVGNLVDDVHDVSGRADRSGASADRYAGGVADADDHVSDMDGNGAAVLSVLLRGHGIEIAHPYGSSHAVPVGYSANDSDRRAGHAVGDGQFAVHADCGHCLEPGADRAADPGLWFGV